MADTRPTGDAGAHQGFIQRVLLVAAVIALALLLWLWREVVLLAFAAILIAVGLHGIADPISRRTPLKNGWALSAAGLLLVSVLGGIFWLFGAQIGAQVGDLIMRLPEGWARASEWIAQWPGGVMLVSELNNLGRGTGEVAGLVSRVGGFTMSMVGAVFDGFVVLFAAIFLAISPREYRNGFLILFPSSQRRAVDDALSASAVALRKWLLGTLVSMTVVAVLVGVALWLLGVPSFVALALIAGVAQFVPVVGPLVAAVPGVLLALGVSPQTALWTALAYFVASQLEANLIYPVIQKRAVSLSPALTLFAILAMGALFGPLGVLLATPILVVATIFVVKLYVNRTLGENALVPGQNNSAE